MINFIFYAENGGKLSELEFIRHSRIAERYVNYVTFDRLKDYEDADNRLKLMLFDMVEMQAEDEKTPEISSKSTGSASVSYNVTQSKDLKQKQFEMSHQTLPRIFVDGVRSNFRG